MWELTNSPTLAAALAPASTAALTLPTSPLHNTVIRPPPMGMVLTRFTLAALTIASLASTLPTYPLVSIIPNASLMLVLLCCWLLKVDGLTHTRCRVAGGRHCLHRYRCGLRV